MTAIVVEIPMTLPSVANLREHWSKKAERTGQQRAATNTALTNNRVASRVGQIDALRPTERVVVRMVRVAPGILDDDNLVSAFKAVRDEVARCLGVDDRDPRLKFECEQERPPPVVRLELSVQNRTEDRHTNAHQAADPAPGRTNAAKAKRVPAESPQVRLARLARSAVVRNRNKVG